MSTIYVDAEVNSWEILPQLSDEELIKELKKRKKAVPLDGRKELLGLLARVTDALLLSNIEDSRIWLERTVSFVNGFNDEDDEAARIEEIKKKYAEAMKSVRV